MRSSPTGTTYAWTTILSRQRVKYRHVSTPSINKAAGNARIKKKASGNWWNPACHQAASPIPETPYANPTRVDEFPTSPQKPPPPTWGNGQPSVCWGVARLTHVRQLQGAAVTHQHLPTQA